MAGITISWDTNSLTVEIDDDGPGFFPNPFG